MPAGNRHSLKDGKRSLIPCQKGGSCCRKAGETALNASGRYFPRLFPKGSGFYVLAGAPVELEEFRAAQMIDNTWHVVNLGALKTGIHLMHLEISGILDQLVKILNVFVCGISPSV
jgi:hypothetical protein